MKLTCPWCGNTKFKKDSNIRICTKCNEQWNIYSLKEMCDACNTLEELQNYVPPKRKTYDVTPERWRDAEDGDWPNPTYN